MTCQRLLSSTPLIFIHPNKLRFLALLANDYTASVNGVKWSPDGALFGVAYSKHMVQIYSYHGRNDLRNHLEIDTHVGKCNNEAGLHCERLKVHF
ncbi:hypothetical protein ACJW31_05G072200 [Castanea mollissima]